MTNMTNVPVATDADERFLAGRVLTDSGTQPAVARALCASVVTTRGNDWLTPEELWRLLGAYHVPTVPGVITADAGDAAAQATAMGFPVVAKIVAHGLIHKSDIGGVRTDLWSAADVRAAFADLLGVARAEGLSIQGIQIQPMILGGIETMVGLTHDALLGAVVRFGLGGTEVELAHDVHVRSAPLTDVDADSLIRESRAFPRLRGYRGHPIADVDALRNLLLRISQLAQDVPDVLEVDFNPVIVRTAGLGCAVVDARVKVGRPSPPRAPEGAAG